MPIQIRILLQVLHMLVNQNFFTFIYSQHCQFTLFHLSHQRHCSENLHYFGLSVLSFSGEKWYSLVLRLVVINTDPVGSTTLPDNSLLDKKNIAVPVYIVLSFLSASQHRCQNFQYFGLYTVLNYSQNKHSLLEKNIVVNARC
jgi:hypothetical protein